MIQINQGVLDNKRYIALKKELHKIYGVTIFLLPNLAVINNLK